MSRFFVRGDTVRTSYTWPLHINTTFEGSKQRRLQPKSQSARASDRANSAFSGNGSKQRRLQSISQIVRASDRAEPVFTGNIYEVTSS